MGRAPCCDKASVKKGPWSPEEDAKLKEFIEKFGTGGNWIALPQKAGLKRCGKSCRLRWLNYLRPNIRHGEFSDDEDRVICSLYASIGSRWSVIAAQLPGRTDNDIKNYWNTKLKKKLLTMLPSLQETQSFFPSLPFKTPPQLQPSYDHHTSHQFMNTSSSFYNFSNPSFMNVDNTSNSFFAPSDHRNNVPNFSPPQANNLISNKNINDVNDNCFNNSYLGFQDDQHNMCNSPMLMFGSTTTCSSSEGGSYNKDQAQKQQYHIKQEMDQVILQGHILADQMQSQSCMIKNHVAPLHNGLEEVKQLSFTSYLFPDAEENKTTHYQKGMCSYYY